MKGMTKTATFGAAALATGVFACLFSHEHGLVLRQAAGASRPLMMTWFGLFLLSVIVLGVLSAYEMRKFFGSRAERWMLEGAAAHSGPVPELQEAERVRASGEPLEAIRLLREYLQANPYEFRAMARIAEIYRYDLKNDLAAALEYEELLKRKLPDDQWAWSALHLAKLYGRLSEFEKSVALLERLDTDYGHTIAGRRAKKALQQVRNPDSTETGDQDIVQGPS
jgi:tetratricopeptide (TPR) repeat protein